MTRPWQPGGGHRLRFLLECWWHRSLCWRFGHGAFSRTLYFKPTSAVGKTEGGGYPPGSTIVERCSFCFGEIKRWAP